MLIRKLALVAASAMFLTTIALAASPRPAYANKVDCDAVMKEVNAGKHAKDIAKDLNISTSSVYRCKRRAREAAKAATKTTQARHPSAMTAASPAKPAASPAAAASPATK